MKSISIVAGLADDPQLVEATQPKSLRNFSQNCTHQANSKHAQLQPADTGQHYDTYNGIGHSYLSLALLTPIILHHAADLLASNLKIESSVHFLITFI